MSQPDRIAVRILQQRGTPPDGVTAVHVDLAAFVRDIAKVGRDPALLLLTIRALRQRSGSRIRLADLAWILRARPARICTWLDRLAATGRLVYDRTNGSIEIELPEASPPTWTDIHPPDFPFRFELPTHWFVHVLPRIGRTAFIAYLDLLRRDGRSAPATLTASSLARAMQLRTILQARWLLWRLRRQGLVRLDAAHEALVIVDPAPLSPSARRALRRRRRGMRSWSWWFVLALLALILVTLVLARTALRA